MLPLLRINTAISSSSDASLILRSSDGGDSADGILVALLQFEEAAGAWLREMAMQQQHYNHVLSKAKKVAVVLEAAAAKLNSARRTLAASGRCGPSGSSDSDSSSIAVSSIYHLCMSRHDPAP